MDAKIVGTNLVLTMPINATEILSKSGKTFVLATSNGFQSFNLNGKQVIISVNANVKK